LNTIPEKQWPAFIQPEGMTLGMLVSNYYQPRNDVVWLDIGAGTRNEFAAEIDRQAKSGELGGTVGRVLSIGFEILDEDAEAKELYYRVGIQEAADDRLLPRANVVSVNAPEIHIDELSGNLKKLLDPKVSPLLFFRMEDKTDTSVSNYIWCRNALTRHGFETVILENLEGYPKTFYAIDSPILVAWRKVEEGISTGEILYERSVRITQAEDVDSENYQDSRDAKMGQLLDTIGISWKRSVDPEEALLLKPQTHHMLFEKMIDWYERVYSSATVQEGFTPMVNSGIYNTPLEFYLEEMFTNAVDAYVKAKADGEIRIRVISRGGKVVFELSNNGIGVAQIARGVEDQLMITSNDPVDGARLDRLEGGETMGILYLGLATHARGGSIEYMINPKSGFTTTVQMILPEETVFIPKDTNPLEFSTNGSEDTEENVNDNLGLLQLQNNLPWQVIIWGTFVVLAIALFILSTIGYVSPDLTAAADEEEFSMHNLSMIAVVLVGVVLVWCAVSDSSKPSEDEEESEPKEPQDIDPQEANPEGEDTIEPSAANAAQNKGDSMSRLADTVYVSNQRLRDALNKRATLSSQGYQTEVVHSDAIDKSIGTYDHVRDAMAMTEFVASEGECKFFDDNGKGENSGDERRADVFDIEREIISNMLEHGDGGVIGIKLIEVDDSYALEIVGWDSGLGIGPADQRDLNSFLEKFQRDFTSGKNGAKGLLILSMQADELIIETRGVKWMNRNQWEYEFVSTSDLPKGTRVTARIYLYDFEKPKETIVAKAYKEATLAQKRTEDAKTRMPQGRKSMPGVQTMAQSLSREGQSEMNYAVSEPSMVTAMDIEEERRRRQISGTQAPEDSYLGVRVYYGYQFPTSVDLKELWETFDFEKARAIDRTDVRIDLSVRSLLAVEQTVMDRIIWRYASEGRILEYPMPGVGITTFLMVIKGRTHIIVNNQGKPEHNTVKEHVLGICNSVGRIVNKSDRQNQAREDKISDLWRHDGAYYAAVVRRYLRLRGRDKLQVLFIDDAPDSLEEYQSKEGALEEEKRNKLEDPETGIFECKCTVKLARLDEGEQQEVDSNRDEHGALTGEFGQRYKEFLIDVARRISLEIIDIFRNDDPDIAISDCEWPEREVQGLGVLLGQIHRKENADIERFVDQRLFIWTSAGVGSSSTRDRAWGDSTADCVDPSVEQFLGEVYGRATTADRDGQVTTVDGRWIVLRKFWSYKTFIYEMVGNLLLTLQAEIYEKQKAGSDSSSQAELSGIMSPSVILALVVLSIVLLVTVQGAEGLTDKRDTIPAYDRSPEAPHALTTGLIFSVVPRAAPAFESIQTATDSQESIAQSAQAIAVVDPTMVLLVLGGLLIMAIQIAILLWSIVGNKDFSYARGKYGIKQLFKQKTKLPKAINIGPVALDRTLLIPITLIAAAIYSTTGFTWLWLGSFLLGLVIYASVLGIVFLHELAHGFIAAGFGYRLTGIKFWVFGGEISIDFGGETDTETKKMLGVAVAGPLSNFIMALFGLVAASALSAVGAGGTMMMLVGFFIQVNLTLGLFNLFFTVYPADGGRILKALIQRIFNVSPLNALRWTYVLGIGFVSGMLYLLSSVFSVLSPVQVVMISGIAFYLFTKSSKELEMSEEQLEEKRKEKQAQHPTSFWFPYPFLLQSQSRFPHQIPRT